MLEAGLDARRRAAGAGLRVALRRALPPRRRTPHPRRRGPDRGRAADAAGLPARRRGPRGAAPRRRHPRADPDELLGQARRDARHLRGQRLADRDLPRRRPPAAAGDRRDLRRTTGEPVEHVADRRLRRPAAVHLADRPGPGLRRGSPAPRLRARGTRSPRRSAPTRSTSRARTRDEPALLRAVPGAIGKAGAESCYAVALPDGRAVALKTDDGGAAGAAGADGRPARAARRDRGARGGRRRGAAYGPVGAARRRRAGRRDPGRRTRLTSARLLAP